MNATKQSVRTPFAAEYVPQDYFKPLDLNSVFPRAAPLEVDVGCGDGSFLTALAKQNPQRNFLGVERLFGRVRSVCRKIAQQNLNNVRILRIESSYALAHLLPANSVAVFYLLFPDPWPKRRHQRRRIVTKEFLGSVHRALARGGLFMIATDERNYFDEICRLLKQVKGFVTCAAGNFESPATTFEKHFCARGLEIHRLVLRKVSPVK
jgi:tRNA (guanine-N7-)-methyltransferase